MLYLLASNFPILMGKFAVRVEKRGSGYLIDRASTGKTLDHQTEFRSKPIRIRRTGHGTFFQRVIHAISDPRYRRLRQVLAGLAVLSLLLISPITPSQPVQAEVPAGESEYFIPGFSQDLRTILVDIDNDPVITNTMHNVITVSVGGDNTTVYYDHWENGYGTLATGYDERYTANKGDILTFESPAIPSNPRGGSLDSCPGSVFPAGGSPGGQSNYCYDGRDRVYTVGGAVSVAQAFWPTSSGTVFANAWEIYPVKPYETSYVIPVGEDLYPAYQDFEQVFVIAQATTAGTTITINDPRTVGVDVTAVLNRGEVTGLSHIGKGTTVTANHPIQVQFIVGAFNAGIYSESRSYTAVPSALWSSTYYNPVPGFAGGYDTDLYIYNPTASPLRIDFQDTTGSGFFTVPANGTSRYSAAVPNGAGRFVPQNSGVVLKAHDGTTKFWAIGSQDTEAADYNAGFTLIPDTALTSEYFVSWAPGYDIYTCGAPPCTNTSRVFITPTVNNTTVYVDYGPTDGVVDATYTLNRLQVQAIGDPDRDNTGMHIWANYPFAIVWAQNAGVTLGSPAIDAGYTILPFNRLWMDMVVSMDKTANPGSILPAIGQTSTFTLTVETYTVGVSDATVLDVLPSGWEYVAGSTTITLPAGAGTITGAHADPVIAGQNLTWNDFSDADPPDPDPLDMMPDETLTIVYQARTIAVPPSSSLNTATVTGTYGGTTYSSSDSAEVYSNQPDLTVVKSNNTDNYTAIGGSFNWSLQVSNGGSSGSALFTAGQIILRDYLPANANYGAVTVTPGATPPIGPGTITCAIASNILTCTAAGGNVTLPINSSFTAAFSVSATSGTSLIKSERRILLGGSGRRKRRKQRGQQRLRQHRHDREPGPHRNQNQQHRQPRRERHSLHLVVAGGQRHDIRTRDLHQRANHSDGQPPGWTELQHGDGHQRRHAAGRDRRDQLRHCVGYFNLHRQRRNGDSPDRRIVHRFLYRHPDERHHACQPARGRRKHLPGGPRVRHCGNQRSQQQLRGEHGNHHPTGSDGREIPPAHRRQGHGRSVHVVAAGLQRRRRRPGHVYRRPDHSDG
jgi:uncharacterized repeat protein (TIGR01451 family)